MNRLFELSERLANISRARFELRNNLNGIDRAITSREAAIIPDGGWPGSNADTRKAAEKASRAADAELCALNDQRDRAQIDLAGLEVDREIIMAELDAWQWTIRDNEATAAGMLSVFALMKSYEAMKAHEVGA